MQIPNSEAERVQYWISLGQQPGLGAWFTLWRVVYGKRAKPARAKGMKREHCAA